MRRPSNAVTAALPQRRDSRAPPCAAVALLGAVGLSWYLLGPYQTRRLAGSRRDRQQMMRSLAEAHGWSWQEWTTTLNRRWKNAPFSGARGKATNVVSGSLRGHPVLAFDYAYQLSSMDADQRWSTVTYDWSVCVVRLPDQLPILKVTRRGVLGRMVATVLPTGLRVPGRTFRRRFKAWSTDRDFAREVLHARTRQLMVGGGVSCLFEGSDLLCWAGPGQSVSSFSPACGYSSTSLTRSRLPPGAPSPEPCPCRKPHPADVR
jgi:hypothetical protein